LTETLSFTNIFFTESFVCTKFCLTEICMTKTKTMLELKPPAGWKCAMFGSKSNQTPSGAARIWPGSPEIQVLYILCDK
jgi:hypothetical protein